MNFNLLEIDNKAYLAYNLIVKINTKTQWIAGIALVIIVVSAVLYANPNLQKGFLQVVQYFNPPKKVGTEKLATTQIKSDSRIVLMRGECRTANDIDVQLLQTAPQPQNLTATPSRTTQVQFKIIPRDCKLTLQDLDFEWRNMRRRAGDFNEVVHMNISQPQVEVRVEKTSQEFPFLFTGNRLICMEGMDAGTIDLASDTPVIVTKENPAVITLSAILFAQNNENPDGTPNGDSRYRLQLLNIANIPKAVDFGTFTFPARTPVNDHYANFCASPF